MAGLSHHESGLTNDDSTGFVEQEETSNLDSFEWTDEKHSLYLKSMEASFVNQLYSSKDLFNWCPVTERSSDVKLCRQGRPPGKGQFKVQQQGYWQKEFYRAAPQPEEVDGRGTLHANPWIKHFRGGRPEVTPDNEAFEQPLGSSGRMLSSCGSGNITRLVRDGGHHQVSSNFDEEFSDQNFVDEDCENRVASGQRTKRLRTLDATTSINNDQVVLFGLSHSSMQDRNEGCSGSQDRVMERGGQTTKTESAF